MGYNTEQTVVRDGDMTRVPAVMPPPGFGPSNNMLPSSGNSSDPANLEAQLRNMILSSPHEVPQQASTGAQATGPSPHPRHFPHGARQRGSHGRGSISAGRSITPHHLDFVPPERREGYAQFLNHQGIKLTHEAHAVGHHHPPSVDPNTFQRGPPPGFRQPRQLYQPNQLHHGNHQHHQSQDHGPHHGPHHGPQHRPHAHPCPHQNPHPHPHPHQHPQQHHSHHQSHHFQHAGQAHDMQCDYLARTAAQEVSRVEMLPEELELKSAFRMKLVDICASLKARHPDVGLPTISLESFGSLASGFATAGSDMDLAIVTDQDDQPDHEISLKENSLPRILEKELLDSGIGARLLTKTRVPIIKICETPTPELLDALRQERRKWESAPLDEEHQTSEAHADSATSNPEAPSTSDATPTAATDVQDKAIQHANMNPVQTPAQQSPTSTPPEPLTSTAAPEDAKSAGEQQAAKPRSDHQWKRERASGPLEFPKHGVGVQCDINFFNPLGISNTKMLRCYAKCDPRVRPMVLFVKAWAKRRKINSSYSGTLSSYGYVLMVLHYLVNVAQPPVLLNLQHEADRLGLPSKMVDNWEVRFFDDEDVITSKAAWGTLTQNQQPLGALLRGFFQYFAQPAAGQGFIWTQDVLSLRTQGGIVSKQQKGWTGARTEVSDVKEVRHRYLFAIEDPFETAHNVARTVTHNGIVAIRDEFRRAWRILGAIGRGLTPHDGDLFAELDEDALQNAVPVHRAPPQTRDAPKVSGPPPGPEAYESAFPTLGAAPNKSQSCAERMPGANGHRFRGNHQHHKSHHRQTRPNDAPAGSNANS